VSFEANYLQTKYQQKQLVQSNEIPLLYRYPLLT